MDDLDLQLAVDELVKQLKADGRRRDYIEHVMYLEVDRACEEQFDDS